jgi:hypothetical protein
VRPALVGLGVALVLGCGAPRPELDPTESMRGERRRVLQIPLVTLWPTILHALPEEGIEIAHSDGERGTITTRTVRYTGSEVPRRLGEIADVSRARQAGFGRATEMEVTYYLLLSRAGDTATLLRVRSTIEAIERTPILFGPGLLEVVPHRVEVPSRGVVEQELIRRLATDVYTAEEMLLMLGELGLD